MSRLQKYALEFAYAILTALLVLEWFAGCGSDGQCLVLHHTFPMLANIGG